ncbi:MAG: hypothetical protein NVS3B5_15800 [Sphingomicrobium sp.]
MTNLEDRIRRLEDKVAIDELNLRYFLASDGDDFAAVGDSFTDDATFASSGHNNGVGRQGIVDFIRGARAHMGLTIHTPHYGLYNFVSDDSATGLVGAHLELVLGDQSTYGAVRYIDEYRREGDRWKISARDMRSIYVGPWAKAADVFASPNPVQWPGADPLPTDYPRQT